MNTRLIRMYAQDIADKVNDMLKAARIPCKYIKATDVIDKADAALIIYLHERMCEKDV